MLSLLEIIAIIAAFRLLTTPLRRRKEKKLWEQWNKTQNLIEHDTFHDLFFGKVYSIRQKARTGTKAYVNWCRGNASQAIWIPDVWLNYGDYILVRGSEGHGPHHSEAVFYINSLIQRLPHNAESCWNKYNKRLEKKRLKEEKKESTAEKIIPPETAPIIPDAEVAIVDQPEISEPVTVE